MNRSLLPWLILGLASAPLAAQRTATAAKAAPPQYLGTYRMASGELLPAAAGTRRGPEVLFNNTTPTNYYSVPGALQEWIDEGGLRDRNACRTDQINGFQIGYCSTEPDPTQRSGTIAITFYDETTVCSGPARWPNPTCAYVIPNLPLGTAVGTIQCWVLDIDLEGGFECPATLAGNFRTEDAAGANRLFGWGFVPVQANTGPFLAKGGYRASNDFVWFDRSPAGGGLIGCFWFGGSPFAGFHLRAFGPRANSRVYGSEAAAYPRSLDTLELRNTTAVSKTDPGPETWSVMNTTAGRSYALAISMQAQDRAVLGGRATLLVELSSQIGPSPIPMPGGTLTAAIPSSLAARALFVQAVESNGPLSPSNVTALSNGLAHCF